MELDRKVIFSRDGFTVTLIMEPDRDTDPREFDCYSDADVDAWQRDDWRYVLLSAHVEWDGIEIGQGLIGGVEHGSLSEVECDAFEMTPGRTEGNAVVMGSSAWHVTVEALENARDWVSCRERAHVYVDTALKSIGAAVKCDVSTATHTPVVIGTVMVGTVTRLDIPGREYALYVAAAHDWDGEHGTDPVGQYDPIMVGTYDDPEQAAREVVDRAPDTATLVRYATGD